MNYIYFNPHELNKSLIWDIDEELPDFSALTREEEERLEKMAPLNPIIQDPNPVAEPVASNHYFVDPSPAPEVMPGPGNSVLQVAPDRTQVAADAIQRVVEPMITQLELSDEDINTLNERSQVMYESIGHPMNFSMGNMLKGAWANSVFGMSLDMVGDAVTGGKFTAMDMYANPEFDKNWSFTQKALTAATTMAIDFLPFMGFGIIGRAVAGSTVKGLKMLKLIDASNKAASATFKSRAAGLIASNYGLAAMQSGGIFGIDQTMRQLYAELVDSEQIDSMNQFWEATGRMIGATGRGLLTGGLIGPAGYKIHSLAGRLNHNLYRHLANHAGGVTVDSAIFGVMSPMLHGQDWSDIWTKENALNTLASVVGMRAAGAGISKLKSRNRAIKKVMDYFVLDAKTMREVRSDLAYFGDIALEFVDNTNPKVNRYDRQARRLYPSVESFVSKAVKVGKERLARDVLVNGLKADESSGFKDIKAAEDYILWHKKQQQGETPKETPAQESAKEQSGVTDVTPKPEKPAGKGESTASRPQEGEKTATPPPKEEVPPADPTPMPAEKFQLLTKEEQVLTLKQKIAGKIETMAFSPDNALTNPVLVAAIQNIIGKPISFARLRDKVAVDALAVFSGEYVEGGKIDPATMKVVLDEVIRDNPGALHYVLTNQFAKLALALDKYNAPEKPLYQHVTGVTHGVREILRGDYVDVVGQPQIFRNEAKELSRRWHGRKTYKEEVSNLDLAADFISALLNQPDKVQQVAPNLYKYFHKYLGERSNFKTAYDWVRELAREGGSLQATEDMTEKVWTTETEVQHQKDMKRREIKSKADKRVGQAFVKNFLDNMEPQLKLSGNSQSLQDTAHRYRAAGTAGDRMMQTYDTLFLKPVMKFVKKHGVDNAERKVGEILFLNRVANDPVQAKKLSPMGYDQKTAAQDLKLLNDRGLTDLVVKQYHKYNKQFIKLTKTWDHFPPEFVARVRENINYAPLKPLTFFKDILGGEKQVKDALGPVTYDTMKQYEIATSKGSLELPLNPVFRIPEIHAALIRYAYTTKLKSEMAAGMKKHNPKLLVPDKVWENKPNERYSAHPELVFNNTHSERIQIPVIEVRKPLGPKKAGPNKGEMKWRELTVLPENFSQAFEKLERFKKKGWEYKVKSRMYRVPKTFLDALTDPKSINDAWGPGGKLLAPATAGFRTMAITLSIGFIQRNAIRDFFRTARNADEVGVLFYKLIPGYIRGVAEFVAAKKGKNTSKLYQSLHEDANLIEWGRFSRHDTFGSDVSERYVMKYQEDTPEKYMKLTRPLNKALQGIQRLVAGFDYVLQATETASKYAGKEWLLKLREQGRVQMSDAKLNNIVRTQFGSPAYLRRGHYAAYMNTLSAFANARKEAYRGDFEAMRHLGYSRYAARMFVTAAIPAALQAFAAYGALDYLFGEEGTESHERWAPSKILQKFTDHKMKTNFIIPFFNTKDGQGVGFKFPMVDSPVAAATFMVTQTVTKFLLEQAAAGDEEAIGELNSLVQMVEEIVEVPLSGLPGLHPIWRTATNMMDMVRYGNFYNPHRGEMQFTPGQMARGEAFPMQKWMSFAKVQAGHWAMHEYIQEMFMTDFDTGEEAARMVKTWLNTPFMNTLVGNMIEVSSYGMSQEFALIENEERVKSSRIQAFMQKHYQGEKLKTNEKNYLLKNMTTRQFGYYSKKYGRRELQEQMPPGVRRWDQWFYNAHSKEVKRRIISHALLTREGRRWVQAYSAELGKLID